MHLSLLLVVWSCLVGRSLGIDVSAFLAQIPECAVRWQKKSKFWVLGSG